MTLRALVVPLALACLQVGCIQSSYLLQAAYGQDEIAYRTRPIEDVLEDERVSERTKAMLSLIGDVKLWGEHHGLKPTDNYTDFVDVKRSAVVYVVSAAHPLRFESKTWWFPVVGSVPYLGWFRKRDAVRFAKSLADDGYDVDLRGASAYSTLGWFDDPVLSSMIRARDSVVGDLVNVVLHESVHATHYVNSQSYFNESLADFVADTLTLDYLTRRLQLDRWQMLAYEQAAVRREQRTKRFHRAFKELEAVYTSDIADAEKLAHKARITTELRDELQFWRPINNAVLAQSRTYHAGSPVFEQLYERVGRDWKRFWAVIQRVDGDSFAKRQQHDLAEVISAAATSP